MSQHFYISEDHFSYMEKIVLWYKILFTTSTETTNREPGYKCHVISHINNVISFVCYL